MQSNNEGVRSGTNNAAEKYSAPGRDECAPVASPCPRYLLPPPFRERAGGCLQAAERLCDTAHSGEVEARAVRDHSHAGDERTV